MRVTAFARYGPRAASTRQRLLQYFPYLREAGVEVDCHTLLDDDYVASLATGERYSWQRIMAAYASRIREVIAARKSDLLWVYSDLFPYFPALFERLVTLRGQRIVYDLDDAFFQRYADSRNPVVRALVGCKFRKLFGRAAACCCGNSYLLEYALSCGARGIVLPTVVDTEVYRPAAETQTDRSVTIGWIGSPTTWPQVRPYLPLLEQLCRDHDVRVRVIGAGKSAESDHFANLELIEWNETDEVAEVQKMDIGIMPLFDRPFERGKSGYKLIQYMACGLPVVASPVGANREIVSSDTGILAANMTEWSEALSTLISDGELRKRLGWNGRKRVEAHFSLDSQAPRLINLLKSAARQAER